MSPLAGRWICLSGAVPELDQMSAYGGSQSTIHLTVKRLIERVLAGGGNIAHGNHPTITPILEEVALTMLGDDATRRVRLYGVRSFYKEGAAWAEFEQRNRAFAEVIEVGGPDDGVATAISEMRRRMIGGCDAMACIGGRHAPVAGTGKQGMEEEAEVLLALGRPVFLMGAFGGATRDYYRRAFARDPSPLHNHLTPEENERLNGTATPWEAVDLVMEGFRRVAACDWRVP